MQVVPASLICPTPPSFWRNRPENATAVLSLTGFSNPGVSLQLLVARDHGIAIPFVAQLAEEATGVAVEQSFWRLNGTLIIAASGIGTAGPQAVFLEADGDGQTCPPALAVNGEAPASSNCTVAPCLELAIPSVDWPFAPKTLAPALLKRL